MTRLRRQVFFALAVLAISVPSSLGPAAAQTPESTAISTPETKEPPPSPGIAAPVVPTIQTDGTGSAPNDARIPRDLSPWSMFLAADILVKAVMLSLTFASVLTWTILIGKTIELGVAKRRLSQALRRTDTCVSACKSDPLIGVIGVQN